MKYLTISDLLARKGEENPAKIEKIRQTLKTKIPAPQENSTAAFVLKIFNLVIAYNQDIVDFSYSKHVLLVSPFWNDALPELNQLIERTVVNELLLMDTGNINVTDEESMHAAEAMVQLLEIHHQGFYEGLDEPDLRIKNKQTDIMDKITAYNNGIAEQTRNDAKTVMLDAQSKARKNFRTLNDYVTAECEKIRTISDQNSRVEQYENLNEFATKTINDLYCYRGDADTIYLYPDESPVEYERALASIADMSRTLEIEKASLAEDTVTMKQRYFIIFKFNELYTDFFNKIKRLEDRRDSVSELEKQRYTPAITDANDLLLKLQAAIDAFEKTGNIATFTRITGELFTEYQAKDSFKTNRANPWFRMLIQSPIEQLKAFINQISEYLYTKIYREKTEANEYKGTIFGPSETDTTTKLNEFEHKVEHLIQTSVAP